jgi:hypothetical protein
MRAWRSREQSQQPTYPQVRHSRRCTHGVPSRRHSSHPSGVLGTTGPTSSRCGSYVTDTRAPDLATASQDQRSPRDGGAPTGQALRRLFPDSRDSPPGTSSGRLVLAGGYPQRKPGRHGRRVCEDYQFGGCAAPADKAASDSTDHTPWCRRPAGACPAEKWRAAKRSAPRTAGGRDGDSSRNRPRYH